METRKVARTGAKRHTTGQIRLPSAARSIFTEVNLYESQYASRTIRGKVTEKPIHESRACYCIRVLGLRRRAFLAVARVSCFASAIHAVLSTPNTLRGEIHGISMRVIVTGGDSMPRAHELCTMKTFARGSDPSLGLQNKSH